ncbi:helix-turn-helix domain-containing protein [Rhodococcus sp. JG-3]|uniref:helix-turn-helix domain-containing protein n=1 Tax=Rhodococcus sp. JG-3 TaxID=1305835 RepID=UPI0004804BF2|nr:helix-turn-helix domain-containing protein [Rhodococcus sp. JG-3]
MTILAEQTVMPPTGADAVATLRDLVELLERSRSVVLTNSEDGTRHVLPDSVRDVLRKSLAAMVEHQAVTIAGSNTVLTTQDAAELLGISRPTLVQLLETEKIPYTKPNRHRRILLEDVLAYQRQLTQNRRLALDAMTAEAAEDDSYRTVNGFTATR